jgi:hypothetical protein
MMFLSEKTGEINCIILNNEQSDDYFSARSIQINKQDQASN